MSDKTKVLSNPWKPCIGEGWGSSHESLIFRSILHAYQIQSILSLSKSSLEFNGASQIGVEQNQKKRLPVDSGTYWFSSGTHQKRKFNGASQRSLKSLVFRVQLYPNRNGRARVQKCPGLSRRSQGSHEKTRFFSIQHFPILSPRLVSSTGLVPCVMLESSPLVCIWSILCPLFVWITVTIIQSSQFKINLSIISPVLTFQQLFEEEGVPITAEEVLDTNFKLKKKFHDIPVVSQNWIIPHFWIESQSQVRAPMGVHKRIHIQRICQLPEVWKLGENGNM